MPWGLIAMQAALAVAFLALLFAGVQLMRGRGANLLAGAAGMDADERERAAPRQARRVIGAFLVLVDAGAFGFAAFSVDRAYDPGSDAVLLVAGVAALFVEAVVIGAVASAIRDGDLSS